MTKKDFDYTAARKELQEVLEWFESGSADLDKAHYHHVQLDDVYRLIVDVFRQFLLLIGCNPIRFDFQVMRSFFVYSYYIYY